MYSYKRKSRLKMVAHRLIGVILFILFILFCVIALPLYWIGFWSVVNWLTGGDCDDDYIDNLVSSWQSTIEKFFDTEEMVKSDE